MVSLFTNHSLKVEVRVGRENTSFVDNWTEIINDLQIDRYGSVWGESEVLFLGSHFNLYSSGIFNKLGGSVHTSTKHVIPSSIMVNHVKKPASSVSGNFGEVLTILSLESRIAPRPLIVSHLTSVVAGRGSIKCPDLIVESTPILPGYFEFRKGNPEAPLLPNLIPGECKNNAFLKALKQLVQYWKEIGCRSQLFGFGLISSINYNSPPLIKLNILVPKSRTELALLLYSQKAIDELVQNDFEGCLYGF